MSTDETLDPPVTPLEQSAARADGITVSEDREWRLALIELQGRAGGPPSAARLAALMRRGRGVPPMVAVALADFLDGNDGRLPVVLEPHKNGSHTGRMQRVRNHEDRVRIGLEIIRDRESGMTVEEAVAKRVRGGKQERSYLFKCYNAARVRICDPTKFECITDPEEINRIGRVHANLKNDAD
ncbi:hypothetical protein [Methylocystis sp. ATCC 49242]|uniref:hypothetical protein n=1 Tax=Methylocystis sp. ATCC 49242 TaxID=622637 RepID=UPI0011855330|nr:hypothetical protein [Methylocystis sp. ATCC 49242]